MTLASTILATQAASLEAFYPCDDAALSSVLADASGNSRDLTLAGTESVGYSLAAEGHDGNAVHFLGTGYALRTDSILGNTPAAFTILMLVKGAAQASKRVFALGNSTDDNPGIHLLTSAAALNGFVRTTSGGIVLSSGGGVAFDDDWHLVAMRFNGTHFDILIDDENVLSLDATLTSAVDLDRTTLGALTRSSTSSQFAGLIQDAAIWSASLSDLELTAIFDAAFPSPLTITTPKSYRTYQHRSGSATCEVTGTCPDPSTTIEYQFAGGGWKTLDASPSAGAFSGAFTLARGQQGTLEVRTTDAPATVASVNYVGCGEVIGIYGQSNASGRGTNSRTYSHHTLKATQYTGVGWKELSDPVDANANVLDSVATESQTPGGHWVHAMATALQNILSVPIGIVVVAKGGTGIVAFKPSTDHVDRSTLYGSLNFHLSAIGGCSCVLWWQGETDANAAMTAETYAGHLEKVANAIKADLSCVTIPCLLQSSTGITDSAEDAIRDGTNSAIAINPNLAIGPDFSGIASDDDYHFTTDAKIDQAGNFWAASVASTIAKPSPTASEIAAALVAASQATPITASLLPIVSGR